MVTQVSHLSTMRETWVPSLGREDPLEKEMATHSSTIAWKISLNFCCLAGSSPWGHKESEATENAHTYKLMILMVNPFSFQFSSLCLYGL